MHAALSQWSQVNKITATLFGGQTSKQVPMDELNRMLNVYRSLPTASSEFIAANHETLDQEEKTRERQLDEMGREGVSAKVYTVGVVADTEFLDRNNGIS